MSPEAGFARIRTVYLFALALIVGAALLLGWTQIWTVPGYLSLLFVATIARLWGLRAAVAASVATAVLLWFRVLPSVFPGRPLPFLLLRLLLFLAVSFVIALIVLQKDETEQRYQRLVDVSPDGIGMIGQGGQIVYANPALLRILGATKPEQVIGRNTVELVHPDQQDRARGRVATLRRRQPLEWIEETWVRLVGKTIQVEVFGLPGPPGGEILGQGFVRDLTDRKQGEARIAESRRRFEALFNAAIDAILFLDSNGRYVDANPAASRLLGYTHEEILTKKRGDFTRPEDRVVAEAAWHDLQTGGTPRREYTVLRKDGRTVEVEFQVVTDVMPGIHAGFIHDISARKAAERSVHQLSVRLLQLQDEERRRISRQLHDTTAQNLAAIRLILSRIGRGPAASDPAIRDAIDECLGLTDDSINEIRTLSYLLHPPMIEEAGLLPALRWYAQGFGQRSGIKMTLDFPEELDRLPADVETAVFRIIQEALTNIQRHSGSTVARIRLEEDDDVLHLAVEDEGHGMPAHLRDPERVFAASGVGIAGMRERAIELGGNLRIESRDNGTAVLVTLPISRTH